MHVATTVAIALTKLINNSLNKRKKKKEKTKTKTLTKKKKNNSYPQFLIHMTAR